MNPTVTHQDIEAARRRVRLARARFQRAPQGSQAVERYRGQVWNAEDRLWDLLSLQASRARKDRQTP